MLIDLDNNEFSILSSFQNNFRTNFSPQKSVFQAPLPYQLFFTDADNLSFLSMEHLHEQSGVGSVALHVFEVKEVLSSCRHWSQLRQEGHQLVVLIGNICVAIMAVLQQNLMNLLAGLLDVGSVVEVSNFRWIK